MMFSPEAECRPLDVQRRLDDPAYREQVRYLFERSPFYARKLRQAGFTDAAQVGGLENLHNLPFTEKDEIRLTQAGHPPFGEHLACDPADLIRIYSTSGTSGTPCYIGLTRADLDMFATVAARGYTAAGFRPGQRLAVVANAGPFVAGSTYYGLDKIGCTVIPVGTGNTERLVGAIQRLGATAISGTPSYGLYLIDWCAERGIDTRTLGLTHIITAGEPGGGDPVLRARLEDAFHCTVREVMGTADVTVTAWAEDEDGLGMHFMARDYVHVELIDPRSGEVLPWEDGVQGELVYTALRRQAMPVLRFRSRDHVVVTMRDNPTGRTGPRIRCIGRTDDMLIVRGVNLFPTAIRGVLQEFHGEVGDVYRIRPREPGVAQNPPLPIVVEASMGPAAPAPELAARIETAIRSRLVVATRVEIVPYGSLPRSEYKSGLVDYSQARR